MSAPEEFHGSKIVNFKNYFRFGMKLSVIPLLILLLCSITLFAQNNYSIKGSVLDTASGTGLHNASITVAEF
jgi:hypothetical protein